MSAMEKVHYMAERYVTKLNVKHTMITELFRFKATYM